MTDPNPTATPRPDRPLRVELAFELPGSPEQVWDAIATARGLSSWFLPTDMDERLGGAMRTHMGPDASSPARITAYDAPHRFAYEEPEWAELFGHPEAQVTPLASEFLIEARSGGTCVLRIVSSAFGWGADWENEALDDMLKGWTPFFEHLRLYLTHFAGQYATLLTASTSVASEADAVRTRLRAELGAEREGDTFEARGLKGRVEHVGDLEVLALVHEPVPGMFGITTFPNADGTTYVQVGGYLFTEGAPAYVAREQAGWQAWLDELTAAPERDESARRAPSQRA